MKILLLEIRIIFKQFPAIRIGGQNLEDAPDRDAHAADARMAGHFTGLDGDPIKWFAEAHMMIIHCSTGLPTLRRWLGGRFSAVGLFDERESFGIGAGINYRLPRRRRIESRASVLLFSKWLPDRLFPLRSVAALPL